MLIVLFCNSSLEEKRQIRENRLKLHFKTGVTPDWAQNVADVEALKGRLELDHIAQRQQDFTDYLIIDNVIICLPFVTVVTLMEHKGNLTISSNGITCFSIYFKNFQGIFRKSLEPPPTNSSLCWH